MENFIKKQEQETKTEIYYIIICDDKKSPKGIDTDMYFDLWEIDKMNKVLQICEDNNLNFDLVIEEFDKEKEELR